MHQLGNVHCDLKPINILLTSTGDVKVIDLAGVQGGRSRSAFRHAGLHCPEQVNRLPVTQQTDVSTWRDDCTGRCAASTSRRSTR